VKTPAAAHVYKSRAAFKNPVSAAAANVFDLKSGPCLAVGFARRRRVN
jgi:hypothetical protein